TNTVPGTANISFSGINANYNLYAAINDGPGGAKVALTSFIDNSQSTLDGVGNIWALVSNSPSNYSGGTTVTKQCLQANASNAFGTGPIVYNLNITSTNTTRFYCVGSITLPNNITFATANPYSGYGDIQDVNSTSGNTILNGSVTIDANDLSGG